jgi:hypothetical protein
LGQQRGFDIRSLAAVARAPMAVLLATFWSSTDTTTFFVGLCAGASPSALASPVVPDFLLLAAAPKMVSSSFTSNSTFSSMPASHIVPLILKSLTLFQWN